MKVQKLRILELGFNELTGEAGGILFKDGVSVEPVSREQSARLAAAMRCEFVNGSNPSPSGTLVEEVNTTAEVVDALPTDVEPTPEKQLTGVALYLLAQETKAAAVKYTRADLEKIADEDGISGVRSIAEEFNVKSNSIVGLIEAIVKAQ